MTTHVECCQPRGLPGDSAPMVFIGVDHVDTIGHTQCMNISDSEKESRCSESTNSLHKQFSPRNHSYQRVVGTLLKYKFPDASQRPILQAGLAKVSGLLC